MKLVAILSTFFLSSIGYATTFNQPVTLGSSFILSQTTDATSGTVTALSTSGLSNIRLTAATALQGLANGISGKSVCIENATGSAFPVQNQNTGASAANRILTGTGADFSFAADSGLCFNYDGTTSRWRITGSGPVAATGASVSPTQTIYTSGSGTYTLPANVVWIRVRMIGGGGGGSGSGTTGPGDGTSGGNSTFGSSTCYGGVHGVASTSSGGAGGTATLGTGAVGFASTGNGGGGVIGLNSGTLIYPIGGLGGSGPYGGASPSTGAAVSDSIANSGAGGPGAGMSNVSGEATGPGGGAGGFIDAIISSPASTYSYAIGAGGTGGGAAANGHPGGAGGSGYLVIEEHY